MSMPSEGRSDVVSEERRVRGDVVAPVQDAVSVNEEAWVPARLLPYRRERYVAVAVHATVEILEGPRIVHVPGGARHCHRLVRWRGRWLALLELDKLLQTHPSVDSAQPRPVLVVAYQPAPGHPVEHAALELPALPGTVLVSDAMACELPSDHALWPELALSCFTHEGEAVPVLDVARLFTRNPGPHA